jgi:hypothetical protein
MEKYSADRQATDENVIRHRHTLILNIYCFSMATVVMRTRLNATLCAHCLSCLCYGRLIAQN